MFRSLWFRLIGTLAIVTAIALAVVTVTTSQVIAQEFDIYAVRSGEIWAVQLAPVLAERYKQDGNWDQAQEALNNPWQYPMIIKPPQQVQVPDELPSVERSLPGIRPGDGPGRPPNDNMWGMMNIHFLLVDTKGVIVADSQDKLLGETARVELVEHGTPVELEGEPVGVLIAIPADAANRAVLYRNFLFTVNRSVLLAALLAGASSLFLGTLLFRRITKPLSELEHAARTVGTGKLAARVPVKSKDEIGMVAEAFNQMTGRLEKQQNLRKQMVADIAHDLRTPLSVMQGTVEAMQDGVLKANQKELKGLHTEIRRLTRLVEDLRTLSLADEGQLRLDMTSVDVASIVEQVIQSQTAKVNGLNVTMQSEIAPHLAPVNADEDRLVEVLANLLDNALRYTPPGGTVTVSAAQEASQIVTRVRDTGPGIPEEDLPFVFERFWRGDKSRNRESGGSGMGLAIVRQLVELQGGTITVESPKGEGTVFTIRLPANSTSS
jgi:signal transduction histidine kinase